MEDGEGGGRRRDDGGEEKEQEAAKMARHGRALGALDRCAEFRGGWSI
jgi:hypothetical protein